MALRRTNLLDGLVEVLETCQCLIAVFLRLLLDVSERAKVEVIGIILIIVEVVQLFGDVDCQTPKLANCYILVGR